MTSTSYCTELVVGNGQAEYSTDDDSCTWDSDKPHRPGKVVEEYRWPIDCVDKQPFCWL
jgi:hypothetical protein